MFLFLGYTHDSIEDQVGNFLSNDSEKIVLRTMLTTLL